MTETNKTPVGIDLGTTFSCCGVYKAGKVEIIAYNSGKRTIPSAVYYNPDTEEIVVGSGAKDDASKSLKVIYDSKRLIGRNYNDPIVQDDMKHWPFKVIDCDGLPKIETTYNKKIVELSASDVSAEILKWIKKQTDTFIDEHDENKKTKAVITVPAYFDHEQRSETKKAAEAANLEVIQILNEPTAAAIAYAYQKMGRDLKELSRMGDDVFLVYDFGGGTFDVSIVKVFYELKFIQVLATDGDSHLGGEDIDQRLVDYYLKKYKEINHADFIPNSKSHPDYNKLMKKVMNLKKLVESGKITLSDSTDTSIDWSIFEDEDDSIKKLTRANFDAICELIGFFTDEEINERKYKKIYSSTMDLVDKVIKEADLKYADIDRVILVGGSSKIVKISELLRAKFPETTIISKDINPDEVVAQGATLFANIEGLKFAVSDVISHNIYTNICVDGIDDFDIIIKKNTSLPHESPKPKVYATFEDKQSYLTFEILEGDENSKKKLESKILEISVDNPNNRAGKYSVCCYFKVDKNGMLTIEVKDPQLNKTTTLSVQLAVRSL